MYILGLNIGHNATACLLKDGLIVGCVSEERFSRVKNHSGIPFESIRYLLDEENIGTNDLDRVVLDGHYPVFDDPNFGDHFLKAYTERSFLKKMRVTLGSAFPNLFADYISHKDRRVRKRKPEQRRDLKKQVAYALQCPEEKIHVIDHHLAHALACGFNLFNTKNKKTLIFTLDGEGEGLSATVNIFDGKGVQRIASTSRSASLGYLYAIVTIFLGMKPLQHEFKVMGMAAYAKAHNIEKIYPAFDRLISVEDDLTFSSSVHMPFVDRFLAKEMKFARFDVVAGATQKLLEEKTSEWVLKAIEKTGVRDIALAGGVFMNVKANMRLAALPEVGRTYVMPSCGDESNAMGCCYYGYRDYCDAHNLEFTPRPINDLYLGPAIKGKDVERLIAEKQLKKTYTITNPKDINAVIAGLLAKGEIVARCSGKSEWGARALGNRSILANPSDKETIKVLNETIKDRDFWMPFTPSILDTFEKTYLENPKGIASPHMTITFPSTEKAQKDLPAAMHPYDETIRPQIVTKKANPEYYDLLLKFKKRTKKGGLLNTSFNLHGEPNVLTPEDALHTVENSDLKYLVIDNYLFTKKLR